MVSVIIPSYNSEKTIARCLRSLRAQTFSEPFEVIVADSSQDKTPEIIKKEFSDVKLIRFDQKTDPGSARNAGIKASRGDIICLIDSDCEAAPDWLEQLVSVHRHYDYEAIGGSVENANDQFNNVAWAGYMAEFREFLPQYPPSEREHIPTCNISYKRRVFDKIGFFNPHYYPQEDLEFNYRLRQSGGRIFFIPSAKIYHNHRSMLKSFLQHQKRVGRVTAKMLKILPLEGATIARNKLLATITIPILPLVKWWRTVIVFLKWRSEIINQHVMATGILALGLVPWAVGFLQGAWEKIDE